MNKLFGYFETAESQFPDYDPGLDVECIICFKKLSAPLNTISLYNPKDPRSYFYRTHKNCYESATPEEITAYESTLIDNLDNLKNKER